MCLYDNIIKFKFDFKNYVIISREVMKNSTVPEVVIERLPLYIQKLNLLLREGRSRISSKELGELLKMTSSQIRRDFAYFGGFGKKGTGYDIVYLMESLRTILNLNQIWQMLVVGVGHIGKAVLNYNGFSRKGFEVVAAFDSSKEVIGQKIGGILIQDINDLEKYFSISNVKIAAITVPAEQAQLVCDRLVGCGIKAILNYAPVTLEVPEDVKVTYVDPISKLQKMAYYLE